MQAETLNCPMCGAATSTDAPKCEYCSALLATIACPACFAMMFMGSKHCQRCGAAAARQEGTSESGRKCPRCRVEIQGITIGADNVLECGNCSGLWLDVSSFEKICADREKQAAVLGAASHAPRNLVRTGRVNYVPCPECSELMNRMNFARCSGVIIDICKKHGIWFDRDELSSIVEFIRAGGLEVSRAKEKADLEEERRRLHQEQMAAADIYHSTGLGITDSDSTRMIGIASARGILKFLLE